MLVFPEALLRLLRAQPQVIELGIPYMRLTLGSTLLLSLAIIIESALRADRDTRTPMLIAMVATVVKTALNAVLIFGLLGFPRLELVGRTEALAGFRQEQIEVAQHVHRSGILPEFAFELAHEGDGIDDGRRAAPVEETTVGHRVVLVDDRCDPEIEEAAQRGARVEVLTAIAEVVRSQEDLAREHTVHLECVAPPANESGLTH